MRFGKREDRISRIELFRFIRL